MASSSEHQQEQPALLVLDEQILGVSAADFAPQRAQILDRVQRRMLHRRRRDAEMAEVGEQVFGSFGQGRLGEGSRAFRTTSGNKKVDLERE